MWEKANPLAQDGGAQALNQHQQGTCVYLFPLACVVSFVSPLRIADPPT